MNSPSRSPRVDGGSAGRPCRYGLWPWVLALALCCGCASTASPPASAEASTPFSRGEFERDLLLTGELQAVRSISIKSPQTAIFQMRIQFMAEEGALVRAGDPLLDFDNTALADQKRNLETQILDAETQIVSKRNELASALKDLEIELAEREYEFDRARLEASIDPDVLSRQEWGERQLALEKATRELDETRRRTELTRERGKAELDVLVINRDKLAQDSIAAQDGLALLSIRAPADGLVVYEERPRSTLRFQEGDSCWPGQGVIRLPDLSEMQVEFQVSEVDAPHLQVGMPLRVALDAFPGRELGGKILRIPSMAVRRDEESDVAIFRVVASLAETWVGEMKPGMSARGRVVVERLSDAPLVARAAVIRRGGEYRLATGSGGGPGAVIEPLARNATHYLVSEEAWQRLVAGTLAAAARPGTAGGRG